MDPFGVPLVGEHPSVQMAVVSSQPSSTTSNQRDERRETMELPPFPPHPNPGLRAEDAELFKYAEIALSDSISSSQIALSENVWSSTWIWLTLLTVFVMYSYFGFSSVSAFAFSLSIGSHPALGDLRLLHWLMEDLPNYSKSVEAFDKAIRFHLFYISLWHKP